MPPILNGSEAYLTVSKFKLYWLDSCLDEILLECIIIGPLFIFALAPFPPLLWIIPNSFPEIDIGGWLSLEMGLWTIPREVCWLDVLIGVTTPVVLTFCWH